MASTVGSLGGGGVKGSEINLPFRSTEVKLPGNEGQFHQRLQTLKTRLKRGAKFYLHEDGVRQRVCRSCSQLSMEDLG